MSTGTWRPFIDEIVLKGAKAYALRMLAVKAEHQAKDDLATARTRMDSIAAIHILCDAALDKATTHGAEAVTALAKVATHVTESGTAFDVVATQAALITTAIANAITELGKVNTDLTAAEGVWTSEAHHILTADAAVEENAQDYLVLGDAKIDLINKGDKVAEIYAMYAGVEVQLAALWDSKRKDFLTEAGFHAQTMDGYFSEAINRLGLMGRYNEEGGGRLGMAQAFISEATQRLSLCQEYGREAVGRIEEMQTYVSESEQYMAVADRELELASRYRTESRDNMVEFLEVLKDRAQYRTNISQTSVRQPR